MTVKRLSVDATRCEGHGKCYILAPALFRSYDDYGHSEFVGPAIDMDDEPTVAAAETGINSCPESAISWVEEQP
jgi:ferredoxin